MAAKIPQSSHSCEICGVDGLTEEQMRNHVLLHVGIENVCPFCDLCDVSPDEMLIHVNTSHLDFLTPESEKFTFIDDDEDDITEFSQNVPKQNGWSEKPFCNNNADVLPCTSSGLGKGSPLRSQLNLNLRSKVAPSLPVQQCPMCSYESSMAVELEEHLNRAHFDLTSPSVPSTTTAADLTRNDYRCPICAQTFQNTPDLELHVNLEHMDILSPANSYASASSMGNWSERCPVCCRSNFKNNKEMMVHIESHFDYVTPETPDVSCDRLLAREIEMKERETRRAMEQREFELLRAQYGMDNLGNFKKQSLTNMQKAVYAGEMSVADYYERQFGLREAEHIGVDDGRSCTKGLIDRVKTISSSSSTVIRTLLCTTVDHYSSDYGDKGWGCGYRNLQMMMSSLVHHTGYNEQLYKTVLFGGGTGMSNGVGRSSVPSISKLQQHIEWSWRQGFDTQGAEQLDNKLHNTRKWIGATEIVTALSSLRIRCQLVDFHCPTHPDGSHPELFNWVLKYFQKQEEFKPPLYLQHQGHSRTIVGIEQHRNGSLTLLVFDPSHSTEQMAQLKTIASSASGMRLVRKNPCAMKARQYQIVAACGIMHNEFEYEQSKVLRLTRIPADR